MITIGNAFLRNANNLTSNNPTQTKCNVEFDHKWPASRRDAFSKKVIISLYY